MSEAFESTEEALSILKALNSVQAIIHFEPDGTIIKANQNFCDAIGYEESEIVGKHHRMFVQKGFRESAEYARFWPDLASGQALSGLFPRIHKNGKNIYIRASYSPITDETGKVVQIVKFAAVATKDRIEKADYLSQLNAVSKAQAVIEFELDGTIRWANDNFLGAMGYSQDEIKGKHHRMFIEPEYAASAEYGEFWRRLKDGEMFSGEYKRVGKGGTEVWIQASYNPILDPEGTPYKVIKYAQDITDRKVAMEHITASLSNLAKGDLSGRLPDSVRGDFKVIREAYNETMERLDHLVRGILEASVSITEEAESIAGVASDLSKRCEQQAATVEQTSAAMEQMSTTVKSNAKNAEDSAEAAKNATQHAGNGGNVVKEAISAMDKIEGGATEIRKIISVIDSIAFQTNLLALNAGVEAARAGDAGRGFAVVASEVRALAQRASESARDINALIESSGREVAEGAELVKQTGSALNEIVSAVATVTDGIGDIHKASQEQAAGVTEINTSIGEIDSTTQKTAAISEESAAAASSLAKRATDLQDLVGFFKLEGIDSNSRSRSRSAPPRPTHSPPPAQSTAPRRPPVKQAVGQNSAPAGFDDDEDDWQAF